MDHAIQRHYSFRLLSGLLANDKVVRRSGALILVDNFCAVRTDAVLCGFWADRYRQLLISLYVSGSREILTV